MKRRILSLLLVAVIMFTTFAFELPTNVNARYSHDPASGRYVFHGWDYSSTVLAANNVSHSRPTHSGYNVLQFTTTSSSDPYLWLSGVPAFTVTGYTHVAVTYYTTSVAPLNLYLGSTGTALTATTAYNTLGKGYYCTTVFAISLSGTLNQIRIDFGSASGQTIYIDSIIFTKSLTDAYKAGYEQRGESIVPATYQFEWSSAYGSVPSTAVYYNERAFTGKTVSWTNPSAPSSHTFGGWKVDRYTAEGGWTYGYTTLNSSTTSYTAKGDTDIFDSQYIRIIFTAIWNIKEYTVYWNNWDGTRLETDTGVDHGSTPSYNGSTPTRASTAQYSYTFKGWSPSVGAISSNTTYTAQFTQTTRSYTITFKDYDGTVLQSKAYTYGSTPSCTAPTRAADAQYTYAFAGWDKTVASVTGAATYTATYTATPRNYTITWQNWDGSTIDTTSVAYGNTPTHADPTRAEDDLNTYTFAGWDPTISKVTGAATYKATYTANPKTYNISYDSNGGSTVSAQSYKTDAAITLAAAPTRDGYTFAGWVANNTGNWGTSTYNAGSSVTAGKYGNVTLTAQWTPNSYNVTYDENGGSAVTDHSYTVGTATTLAGAPTKEGHTFAGWEVSSTDGNWSGTFAAGASTGTTLYGDVTLKALWTVNTYDVKWVDGDGNVLRTDTLDYGATPDPTGLNPTKASDDTYYYEWTGAWDSEISTVKGAITYTATFTAIPLGYTIKWVDDDGKEIRTDKGVKEGTVITAPADPYKAPTAEWTYTFTGWDPAVVDGSVTVTGDATYTATYSATKNSYTVTFVDEDGTELISEVLEYGTTPTAPADPEKAPDAQYTYTFAGWDKEIATVTGDATYTATYTSTVNKYTITFVDEDGTTVLKTEELEYGTDPVAPADPEKAASGGYTYTFAGWDPAVVTVAGDATYKATYTATPIQYTISYDFGEGKVSGNYTTTYTVENAITLPAPDYAGFDLEKWTASNGTELWADVSEIAGDVEGFAAGTYYGNVTLTANWVEEQILIQYVVKGTGGSTNPPSEKVAKNSGSPSGSLAVPDKDYRFVGWYYDINCQNLITENEQYVPENTHANVTYYALFELAIADLKINVTGTQTIDENQSYIFDIVKPDGTSLTVSVMGDSTVTVKDVPVGDYTVSEQNGWSWRYENDKTDSTQSLTLTSSPDTLDEDTTNDNTAYFTQTRVEKPAEKALWLGGDGYRKNKYGAYKDSDESDESQES